MVGSLFGHYYPFLMPEPGCCQVGPFPDTQIKEFLMFFSLFWLCNFSPKLTLDIVYLITNKSCVTLQFPRKHFLSKSSPYEGYHFL